MKRTTISLPDSVALALQREARRRHVPVSQVARESLEASLGLNQRERRTLPFIGIGRSGQRTNARDFDKLLHEEWDADFERDRGR